MDIQRSDDEINDLLNICSDQINEGESKFSGMSYEQGIEAGIQWVTGEIDENIME